MQDEKRNCFGRVIQPPAPRVKEGNLNPDEYQDGKGKNVPTKSCVLEDNVTPKYASDGLTVEWSAATPHVTPPVR
jgi:hypothetical protein